MTKQEFARRAMEIVEVCIRKNITFNCQLCSYNSNYIRVRICSKTVIVSDFGEKDFNFKEMKKLVEEYEE